MKINKAMPLVMGYLLSSCFIFAVTCQAQPSSLDIGRLEQVALTVTDISRAERFYEDQLGLRKLFAQKNLLIFDLGGVRLLLGATENQDNPIPSTKTSSTLYLRCADLKLCMKELTNSGIEFNTEAEFVAQQAANDLWLVFFQDPDGNSLALMSESPRGYNPVSGKFGE